MYINRRLTDELKKIKAFFICDVYTLPATQDTVLPWNHKYLVSLNCDAYI